MTTPIERSVHNGRGIVDREDPDTGMPVIGWPAVASEAIRNLAHVTSGGEAIPAPTLYAVLSELALIGHRLPQVLDQLGTGLAKSLEELEVYDDAGDPAESAGRARAHLATASAHARQLGTALEAAQSTIAQQGYGRTSGEA